MYSNIHFYTSASSRIVCHTHTSMNTQRVSLWTMTRAEESNVRYAVETVQSLSTTHAREGCDLQRVLRYNFLTHPDHDYMRRGDTQNRQERDDERNGTHHHNCSGNKVCANTHQPMVDITRQEYGTNTTEFCPALNTTKFLSRI
jgi:hypothetical protein